MNDFSMAARLLLLIPCLTLLGCSNPNPTASPAPNAEHEALSRTEFTDRVENYFEFEPLRAGKPSQIRIHLTDLSDGSPVEKAEVTLVAKSKASSEIGIQTVSRVGKVAGIYV